MIEKLKTLYPAIEEQTLLLLLDNAQEFIMDYCNLKSFEPSLDSIAYAMVREDVTKLYASGLSSESTGGNSVTYTDDYSPAIYKRLNKHKRLRVM